jgi:homoaconitase/3-isopropylmalate dehydratase large subunit
MGMTIIEKILARASGKEKIGPGDLAVVDVDLCVLIDLSFSRGSWREVLKVHDPEKVVVVFDHDVPASNATRRRCMCGAASSCAASASAAFTMSGRTRASAMSSSPRMATPCPAR